jgi:uncharacterized membrane protein
MKENIGLKVWYAWRKSLTFMQSDSFLLGLSLVYVLYYIHFAYYLAGITKPDSMLNCAFALTCAWLISAWTMIAIKIYYKE